MKKRNIPRIFDSSNNFKNMAFLATGFPFPGIIIPGINVYSPLIQKDQPLFLESDIFSVRETDRSGFHKGSEKSVMPRPKKFDPKSCGKSQVLAVSKDPVKTGEDVLRLNGADAFNREVKRLIGNELAEILIRYPKFFKFVLGSLMIGRSYFYGRLVTGDYLCECVSEFLKVNASPEERSELLHPESVLNEQMVALFNKFQQDKYFLD